MYVEYHNLVDQKGINNLYMNFYNHKKAIYILTYLFFWLLFILKSINLINHKIFIKYALIKFTLYIIL